MRKTMLTSIRYFVLILIAIVGGGEVTTVLAQTPTAQSLDLGAQPTLAWDQDLTNVTHFRFYQASVSPTGAIGTATRVSEFAKPAPGTSIEVVWPAKFMTEATFALYVSAVNKPADATLASEGESPKSAPLLVKVAKPTLPAPTQPLNFRIVVKVTTSADGRVSFSIERMEAITE